LFYAYSGKETVQFADDAKKNKYSYSWECYLCGIIDASVVSGLKEVHRWFNVNDRKINVDNHESFILVLEMISNIQA
jgi:hypothetical protein